MATTAPEITTGRKNADLQNARNLSGRLSASASASALAIWSGTWIPRKTKVFPTARQKRPSRRSSLMLSNPAKAGSVTRSHWRNTSTSAKTIGYAANAMRNAAYGADISHPDRASARIDDLARFSRGTRERLTHRDGTVDRRAFVRLRQQIEDLDHVRIEIEIARARHMVGVGRERRPPGQGGREARIRREPAPVRQLAGFLDEHAISLGRREIRDEPRRRVRVPCRGEDGDAAQIRERVSVSIGSAVRRGDRRHVVAESADLELVQLLQKPGADDLHSHGSVDERVPALRKVGPGQRTVGKSAPQHVERRHRRG